MDIISKKLANDRLYAYHGGRFWVWDEGRSIWKESHLMAQKYALNHEADKLLTPEDFLSDPSQFEALESYDVDYIMKNALLNAQPCQNAPIEPVEEEPEVPDNPAVQETKQLDTVPEASASSFDYSGLDTQTVDTLHMAENQYLQGKKMTETGLRWMVNAVSMAHDALCGAVVQQLDNGDSGACPTVGRAHNNQYSENTFRAWCASIGIGKSSAYNLLKVAERFGNIELDGKSILDVQPATLLYEAAKPSAPEEMVHKVTTGEITSSAEYRAILKENQQLRTDRVNALNRADHMATQLQAKESELAKAQKDLDHEVAQTDALLEEKGRLLRECEAAKKARMDAESRADTAEGQLDAATADVNGLHEQNARLNAEKEQAEQRARNAEDALKKQPITAVVDEEEVDRRAHQQAYSIAADMTEELRTKNNRLGQENTALTRQLEEARSASSYDSDDDLNTVCACIRSVMDLWAMAFPAFERLTGKAYRDASDYADEAANNILRDMARVETERAQKRSKEAKA